ncbi:hypothetical protein [Streptomyces sp. NPDC048737]|uniref:hypothetical protein n=1 Tax=unclassified Streptomyces TaxID=2593676 RepID=UPI00342C5F5D
MLGVIGDLPVGTPVAFEAAFGWAWLIELLQDYGCEPHPAQPLHCRAIASARLKNDKADAATLAHLLRAHLLPRGVDRSGSDPRATGRAAPAGARRTGAAGVCTCGHPHG